MIRAFWTRALWIAAFFPARVTSVRARLLRLAVLLVVPGLAIAALLAWRTFETERSDTEDQLHETVNFLRAELDRELFQATLLLRTLAATDELRGGHLEKFDNLARQTAVMNGAIVVQDRDGQEVVDTALLPGAKLPRHPDEAARTALAERTATILPYEAGATGGSVSIVMPVPQPDHAGYFWDLKLIIPAASFQTILDRNALPDGWNATIFDSHEILVARTNDPEKFRGQHAGPGISADLNRQSSGVRNGVALDGTKVVLAYTRSPFSHWVVAVGAPRQTVAQAGLQSASLLVGLGSGLVLLGLLGAVYVARGIAAPIESMAAAAAALGDERWIASNPKTWGLQEADDVAEALHHAAGILQERRQALTELNATLAARVAARTSELAAANRALDDQRQQLGAILDSLPIGVVVHAAAGTVEFVNLVARRVLGLPQTGPIAQGADYDIRQGQTRLSPQDWPSSRALAGEKVDRALVTLMPGTAGGRQVELEIYASPMFDAAGDVVFSLTTLQDVTERLQAEEARRRAQRLEAVGQLTGGVAHEFNNLLMAVSGCLDLLAPYLPETADGRPAALLANAARATARGGRLTRQLLAFARRQTLRVEPLDLNALVLGMKELLEGTLGRGITVSVKLNPDAWLAMADSAQLELVLLNLAINARDAMPGGGSLMIETANAEMGPPMRAEDPPAGPHVVLTVADTGPGMPAHVLARAFEPFFTTKDVGRGSGLGLPQVLGVAQQLGGGVRLTSTPGQGTVMRVYVPRAVEGAVARALPLPVGKIEPKRAALAGMRLLLVDDDADVREIARALLEEMGATVRDAANGAEALLLLRTETVDIVLADLTMPEMTGVELAGAIAQFLPALPVVLMTGYGAASVASLGPHIKATLQKPFRTETLARVLLEQMAKVV